MECESNTIVAGKLQIVTCLQLVTCAAHTYKERVTKKQLQRTSCEYFRILILIHHITYHACFIVISSLLLIISKLSKYFFISLLKDKNQIITSYYIFHFAKRLSFFSNVFVQCMSFLSWNSVSSLPVVSLQATLCSVVVVDDCLVVFVLLLTLLFIVVISLAH